MEPRSTVAKRRSEKGGTQSHLLMFQVASSEGFLFFKKILFNLDIYIKYIIYKSYKRNNKLDTHLSFKL